MSFASNRSLTFNNLIDNWLRLSKTKLRPYIMAISYGTVRLWLWPQPVPQASCLHIQWILSLDMKTEIAQHVPRDDLHILEDDLKAMEDDQLICSVDCQ